MENPFLNIQNDLTLIKDVLHNLCQQVGTIKATDPAPQDIIFNVPDLAKYLKCKSDTIYSNIDKYPRIKDGKSWIFFKSEIDFYLKENRVKTKAEKMEELKADAEKQLELMRIKTKK